MISYNNVNKINKMETLYHKDFFTPTIQCKRVILDIKVNFHIVENDLPYFLIDAVCITKLS